MKNIIFIIFALNLIQIASAENNIKKIILSNRTTCVIDSSDKLKCWGSESLSLNGYSTPSETPVLIDIFPQVANVQMALTFACALSIKNELKCWGNIPGKGGPRSVELLSTGVKGFALTHSQLCYLLETGEIKCSDDEITRLMPIKAIEITSAPTFTCALDASSEVWCWGAETSKEPTKLKNLGGAVKQVQIHSDQLCVLMADQSVKCVPFYVDQNASAKVIKNLEREVQKIAIFEKYGCAIMEGGKVKCWGKNQRGVLAKPMAVLSSHEALTIPNIENAIDLVLEADLACAQLKDQSFKCWGSGFKHLGNGGKEYLLPYDFNFFN